MILHINDATNSAKELYYQSLVLLFLPCEKFGGGDNKNHLYVDAYIEGDTYYANVRLIVDDKTGSSSASERADGEKITQMKNLIGRTLLSAAYKIFGTVPPWGISTGVKPIKLARILMKSTDAEAAYKILCRDFAVTSQKARMAVDACLLEDKLMAKMSNKPCSLYISIPFCPTKCSYCSFVSCTTPRLLSLIPEYLRRLKDELCAVSEIIKENALCLESVYVGGGTPAILDSFQIDELLSFVNRHFDIGSAEFTFEAGRPDCIDEDKLKALCANGVSRLSINTQTTNDEILKVVGRCHTFSDYVRAMESARKIGFDAINTDLIAGLPGESAESFKKSVMDVAGLSPENITIHAFTLKKASSYRNGGDREFSLSAASACEMTDFAYDFLAENNYKPYYVYRQKNTAGNLENVGYSKPSFESVYNIIMMGEYHTVFGVGAGSVTKIVSHGGDKVDRIFSPKYPYEFLDGQKYKGFDTESVNNLLKKGDNFGKE